MQSIVYFVKLKFVFHSVSFSKASAASETASAGAPPAAPSASLGVGVDTGVEVGVAGGMTRLGSIMMLPKPFRRFRQPPKLCV